MISSCVREYAEMNDPTEFAPTQGMREALVKAKDCNYSRPGQQVCQDAGLARQTWYEWCEKAGFLDWWNDQGDKHAKARLAELRNAVMDEALTKAGRQDPKRQAAALTLAMNYADADFRRRDAEASANANAEGIAAFLGMIGQGKTKAPAAEDERSEDGDVTSE